MNNATSQYRQYLKCFARQNNRSLKEAAETAMCRAYKAYCEEVYRRPVCAEEAIGGEQDVQEQ